MLSSLVLWALLGAAAQSSERVLDLTRKVEDETKLKADQPFSSEGCRGQGTGRVRPAPPFTVAIERLNSAEYSMGSLIVADLRLTNTGKQALALPWVLREEFGEGFEGPGAVQAAIGISATDSGGREHTLTGTILRGSVSRPGTTQAIAPGESIKIRFPGWIVLTDGPSAPLAGDAQLFVDLIFSDGECRSAQPVRSPRVNIRLKGGN